MYTVQVLNLDLSCADFHHQLQYVHNKLHKKHYHGHYDFHPQYHHGYNVFHHQCHHGHDRNVNNAINQGRGQLAFHWTNGKCKRTKVTQPGTLSFYLYLYLSLISIGPDHCLALSVSQTVKVLFALGLVCLW